MKHKISRFAALLQVEQEERLKQQGLSCQANMNNAVTSIKDGQKYTKVDIGTSGRYMVENATGNIFGIKGYGQVHKGHFYGTVDEIDQWYWGDYYPQRKASPLPTQTRSGAPVLTFAPQPAEVHPHPVQSLAQG